MRSHSSFVFVSLLALAPSYVFSQTTACPIGKGQELSAANMNPLGIQQYLTKNAEKLKSIEDVVCCLPQSYRDQFAIMHSSNSAQHSDLFGPRAILFDVEPGFYGFIGFKIIKDEEAPVFPKRESAKLPQKLI